jgi:hypothetical protein
MGSPPESPAERRCPACGALVSADASWCGQCFTSLQAPAAAAAAAVAPGPEAAQPASVQAASAQPASAEPGSNEPSWPCPACGNHNPIALDACAVCGTSFATLMRQSDAPVPVPPEEAVRWSLAFPGLGHRRVGRSLDGLTRGILFALLGGMAVLIGLGGLRSSTLIGLFVLYLSFALAVYVGSAMEARRLAEGGDLFLPTRQVLWAGVIVVMGSLGLLVLSVFTATKR